MLESANREATSQASAKSVEHMATPKLERFHATTIRVISLRYHFSSVVSRVSRP